MTTYYVKYDTDYVPDFFQCVCQITFLILFSVCVQGGMALKVRVCRGGVGGVDSSLKVSVKKGEFRIFVPMTVGHPWAVYIRRPRERAAGAILLFIMNRSSMNRKLIVSLLASMTHTPGTEKSKVKIVSTGAPFYCRTLRWSSPTNKLTSALTSCREGQGATQTPYVLDEPSSPTSFFACPNCQRVHLFSKPADASFPSE
jgi:hypothetical protein